MCPREGHTKVTDMTTVQQHLVAQDKGIPSGSRDCNDSRRGSCADIRNCCAGGRVDLKHFAFRASSRSRHGGCARVRSSRDAAVARISGIRFVNGQRRRARIFPPVEQLSRALARFTMNN